MGRKSNAKKIIRELIKEKEEKEKKKLLTKKKSKKQLKKEAIKDLSKKAKTTKSKKTAKPSKKTTAKKKKKKKKKKSKIDLKPILGIVLSTLMLVILVGSGFLIFKKIFSPPSIADYIPEERTLLALELNSNLDHHQLTKFFNLFEDYEQYTSDKLIEHVNEKYQIDFENDVAPWLGRQVGLIKIRSESEEQEVFTYYFAEYLDSQSLTTFIEKLKKSHENIHTTQQEKYVFLTTNEQAITELENFHNSSKNRLLQSPKFRKIFHNLPINKTAFLYLNYEQLKPELFKPEFTEKIPLLNSEIIPPELLNIYLDILHSEGLALIALDDKFAIQTFLNLNTDKIEGKYITFTDKYQANLTKYIADSAHAFWGGKNMESQVKRMLEVFASGNENVISTFDNLLNNYTQKYFGSEVSLNRDILPILQGEFAFSIEEYEGERVNKLIIELENPDTLQTKLHAIANNFAEKTAIYESKVVDYTLPDGTPTKEIRAVPKEIERQEILYYDVVIHALEMGEGKGVYYAFIEGNVVISNNIGGIKGTIELQKEARVSLSRSEKYEMMITPVLKTSDEIAYFNFEKILPVIFQEDEISSYLQPLSNVSIGKNYFNDGITSTTYLHVK